MKSVLVGPIDSTWTTVSDCSRARVCAMVPATLNGTANKTKPVKYCGTANDGAIRNQTAAAARPAVRADNNANCHANASAARLACPTVPVHVRI